MKKNILLPAIFLMIVSLVGISCKKSKDDAVIPAVPYDSVAYTFDTQNRIIDRQNFSVQNDAVTFVSGTGYQYFSGKIVATSRQVSTGKTDVVSYYLNPNGTVNYSMGIHVFSVPNGANTSYDSIYYTYDTDGYNTVKSTIISFQGVSVHDTVTNIFSGGNKVASIYASGAHLTYTYNSYEDKYDLFIKGDLPGLFGKRNKNLIESYKKIDNSFLSTNDYELDGNGYITRCITTNVSTFATSSSTTKTDSHISYNY